MVTIDPDRDVLGVIDVQPTFMPGGELPVPDGEAVVGPVNRLLALIPGSFATQDWHPPGHISFASAHGRAPFETVQLAYGPQVLWPDHALIGSANAALHPGLDAARLQAVFRKGFRPGIDSYSAFRENDRATPTGLAGFLRDRGFRRLFLCGLALDFCVFWSAQDARGLGFEVVVVEDACRGIGAPAREGTSLDEARRAMAGTGVRVLRVADLGA